MRTFPNNFFGVFRVFFFFFDGTKSKKESKTQKNDDSLAGGSSELSPSNYWNVHGDEHRW